MYVVWCGRIHRKYNCTFEIGSIYVFYQIKYTRYVQFWQFDGWFIARVVSFFRSANDTCSSSLSCFTFYVHVIIETHSPVCYSSSNTSRPYRWLRSSNTFEIIFKRSSDLYRKHPDIRWYIRNITRYIFFFSISCPVPYFNRIFKSTRTVSLFLIACDCFQNTSVRIFFHIMWR